jgi:hypothetical protein
MQVFARMLPASALAFAIALAGLAPTALWSQSTQIGESQPFGSFLWTAPAPNSSHALGEIAYNPGPLDSTSPQIVLAPAIYANSQLLTPTTAAWQTVTTANGPTRELLVTVQVQGAPIHITVTPSEKEGHLFAQIVADQPGIDLIDYGVFGASAGSKTIPVPYYDGTVTWLPSLNRYINAWFNWKTTNAAQFNATQFNANQAQYQPLTSGALLPLNEQLNLVVSGEIAKVFPNPGNPVSPNLDLMSGRMIVDIWGGSFDAIASDLTKLGSYGVTNCLAIIHNWQHHGYDNALPDHYPANPTLGGDAGLESATAAARNIGCLVAVHENYVDYYPNYDHFTPSAIALNSDGTRKLSWLNPSTLIQSFATKPTWLVKNAMTESPVIHERYGTTASFLDVSSAVPPGFHVDQDATQPGAGRIPTPDQNTAKLWAFLRTTHQGPVVGEGVNHWYHSGLLDGVEAQTGAGAVPSNIGPDVPLFVNFDLFDIHPYQVNHGMGYVSRWTPSYGAFLSTGQRDAYRMQEIAFGHAPFLDDSDWGDASRALVESSLVTPLASRYGTVKAKSIGYRLNGQTGPGWVSAGVAALTNSFHQVRVIYENGLVVTANGAPAPLVVEGSENADGLTLPQYGWSASGAGVLAYTAQCGAALCDYAEAGNSSAGLQSIFANARNQSDIRIGVSIAGPSVSAFSQSGARAFNLTYSWKVYETTPLNLIAFVHFVDPTQATNEGIVFQGDHSPVTPTSDWQPGQTISDGPHSLTLPSGLPDGTYSVRIGLFDPASGQRYRLAGQSDGDTRYILGAIVVSDGGSKIQFDRVGPQPDDPRLNAAGSVVAFPSAQTDGMFSLVQEQGSWILHPFPRFRNFTVLIRADRIPMPASVETTGGTTPTVIPIQRGEYWQLPLNGASAYTW